MSSHSEGRAPLVGRRDCLGMAQVNVPVYCSDWLQHRVLKRIELWRFVTHRYLSIQLAEHRNDDSPDTKNSKFRTAVASRRSRTLLGEHSTRERTRGRRIG